MSTYSDNLRIELITTGTQAGTWGTTTNTNLGTIIEDSIAGYAAVAVSSANQAFTAVNGAADQARCAIIELTTSTGSTFAVYAPPVTKEYIIWNNSSYTATIYNSTVLGNTTAAGTGVAIPAGDKVTVFSDGTNFYQAGASGTVKSVALSGGTTGLTVSGSPITSSGTITLAGTLATANGGTGVTTSTGTGNNVLSDSPTLTGIPLSPTAASGTNTTQIATTAFVQSAVGGVSAAVSGEIKMWPTASAPAGYLLCNGAAVSRSTYNTLFGLIGTTFGAGDGSTTFNLPNYVNRMPIGAGSTYAAGATGGSADAITVAHTHSFSASSSTDSAGTHTHTLTDPGHTHNYYLKAGTGTFQSAAGNELNGVNQATSSSTTGISVNSGGAHTHTVSVSGTTSSAGSSGTGANLPPYIGIYFIIKT